MSLELVREVTLENPELLQENVGRTCYLHTKLLIDKLRARGHKAYFMCKSPGEGQYVPPGFAFRIVQGLDGKDYQCSGVSHDAIWCDHKQFDTIGSANEHDRPIYRRGGDPNWSFDPNDGPRITATPVWNEIPAQFWRANNPPLKESGFVIQPSPVPLPSLPNIEFPPRDLVGQFFVAANALYAKAKRPNRTDSVVHINEDGVIVPTPENLFIDNEGIFVWLPEYLRYYVLATGPVQDRHAHAMHVALTDLSKGLGL